MPADSGPELWVGHGRAVYRGPALGLAPHSTAVPCVVVGLDDSFEVRPEGRTSLTARTALVPPRQVHQVIGEGRRMMFLYLDVPAAAFRSWWASMLEHHGTFGVHHTRQKFPAGTPPRTTR